jgi:hypothetical protein
MKMRGISATACLFLVLGIAACAETGDRGRLGGGSAETSPPVYAPGSSMTGNTGSSSPAASGSRQQRSTQQLNGQ